MAPLKKRGSTKSAAIPNAKRRRGAIQPAILPGSGSPAAAGPSGLQSPARTSGRKRLIPRRFEFAEEQPAEVQALVVPGEAVQLPAQAPVIPPPAVQNDNLADLVRSEFAKMQASLSAENEALKARIAILEQLPPGQAGPIQPEAGIPPLPAVEPLLEAVPNPILLLPPIAPQVADDQIAWPRQQQQQGKLPEFITSAIPVGGLLNVGLRDKIAKDDFINMSEVIDNHEDLGAGSYLAVTQAGCKLVPSSRKGRSLDWCEFGSAWNIFIAVRTRVPHDPSLPGQLAKHYEVLFNLQKAGHDWSFYDTNFRRLVSLKMAYWGQVHEELNSKARSRDMRKPAFRDSPGKTGRPGQKVEVPENFCYKFHSGAKCTFANCRYTHNCPECNSYHRMINCPGRQPFRGQQNISKRNSFPQPKGSPAQQPRARN